MLSSLTRGSKGRAGRSFLHVRGGDRRQQQTPRLASQRGELHPDFWCQVASAPRRSHWSLPVHVTLHLPQSVLPSSSYGFSTYLSFLMNTLLILCIDLPIYNKNTTINKKNQSFISPPALCATTWPIPLCLFSHEHSTCNCLLFTTALVIIVIFCLKLKCILYSPFLHLGIPTYFYVLPLPRKWMQPLQQIRRYHWRLSMVSSAAARLTTWHRMAKRDTQYRCIREFIPFLTFIFSTQGLPFTFPRFFPENKLYHVHFRDVPRTNVMDVSPFGHKEK